MALLYSLMASVSYIDGRRSSSWSADAAEPVREDIVVLV